MSRPRLVQAGELRLMPQLAREIDAGYVRQLRRALRQGAVFPPLTIDAADGITVVDGAHRLTATLEEFDADAKVKTTEREFADEADRLAFTFASMLEHGRRPTPMDEARVFRLLEVEHGWSVEQIARRFRFADKDVLARLGRTVSVHAGGELRSVYLKSAVRTRGALDSAGHGSGGTIELDAEQVDLLARATGITVGLHVRQLADLHRLGPTFWPRPSGMLIENIDDALAFLTDYKVSLDAEDAEHAA